MAVTKKTAVKATAIKADALKALMGAALALPGISTAAEQGYRSEDIEIGVHHSEYTESGDRMTVKADQLSITGPIAQNFEANFSATRDVTSGASPVVNFLDGEGKPHQFLETGASIKDQRDIYEGTLSYYGDNSLSSIKLGTSEEDDYTSDYFSLSHRIDFNRKLTSLTFGYGHSDDDVWNSYNPSVLLEEPSIFKTRKKDEFNFGFGQIINKNTTLQLALTYVDSSGFLSDPYKKTFVVDEAIFDFRKLNIDIAGIFSYLVKKGVIQTLNDSGTTAFINRIFPGLITDASENILGVIKDNRPEKREQWISLLRLSHYFKSTNSALHTDYRYSDDSWGAYSHTLEFKWNIGLGLGWQVSPGLRFYSQHSAFFYNTFFETIPDHGYVSSDYRLAGFGAISKKLEISKEFSRDFTIYLHYEEYERRYDYEQGGQTNGDPLDDYEFKAFSVSFDVRF
ncbi:MAG: DUF3570 domain-containing protein [Pseudomonadales bacterium]|nr:DUF3570 domain-containing protein [Pseudomonadales bacterium]